MRDRIFLHLTWTTADRARLLDHELASFLSDLLPRIAIEERSTLLQLGMVTTHVHALVRVHPVTVLPRLVQRFKGTSSALAGKQLHRRLRWAPGYNVESVWTGSLARVARYVAHQHLHHREEAIIGWPIGSEDEETISSRISSYLASLDGS